MTWKEFKHYAEKEIGIKDNTEIVMRDFITITQDDYDKERNVCHFYETQFERNYQTAGFDRQ